MPINKSTEYGNIEISLDAIANLAGGAITECYGIVGMASQKTLKDGIRPSGCRKPSSSCWRHGRKSVRETRNDERSRL